MKKWKHRVHLNFAQLGLIFALAMAVLQTLPTRADFINGDQLRLYCT